MVKRRSNEIHQANVAAASQDNGERQIEDVGAERTKLLDEVELLVMSGDLPRVSCCSYFMLSSD